MNWGSWGANLSSAQLAQSLTPIQSVTPANLVFTKVAAGQYFTCALANTGSVYCWGTDQVGQLGSNLATTSSIVPVLVNNVAGAVDIAAGFSGSSNSTVVGRACAITSIGQVYCWGAYYNTTNALTNAFLPLQIAGISNPKAISVSANFACVLRTTNDVQCFGRNNYGQLGTGTVNLTASTIAGGTPVTNLSNVISISVGEDHACANHNGGLISCWGRNLTLTTNVLSGQLGKDPTMLTLSATPLLIDGQTDVEFVAAGDAHNCIGLNSGTVRCFGYNANLQIGYVPPQGQPNPNYIFSPTTVVLP